MEMKFLRRLVWAAAFGVCAVSAAHAEETAAGTPDAAPQAAADGPWEKAAQAMQPGPRKVALSNQATLDLPEGSGFVPPAQGKALMEAMGNSIGDTFLGLIVPTGEDGEWMATVDFEDAGYIKDDDARHWKADELLDELKQGTEAGNERRARLGFSPLEVTHWIEPPAYESATQRLVWSVELREKSAPAGTDNTVNYNTYVLGREDTSRSISSPPNRASRARSRSPSSCWARSRSTKAAATPTSTRPPTRSPNTAWPR